MAAAIQTEGVTTLSLVSDEVPRLVLEVLLEVKTLYKAVAQAPLLSWEEAGLLQGQEAALCAL